MNLQQWGQTPVHTSELRGEEQGLQQRVQVTRPSLVLDAAQIGFSSGRRWLVSRLGDSPFGGGSGGEAAAFLLIFFKKIPKHVELKYLNSSFLPSYDTGTHSASQWLVKCVWGTSAVCPLAISSWSCRALCWQWPGSLWNKRTSRDWTYRL